MTPPPDKHPTKPEHADFDVDGHMHDCLYDKHDKNSECTKDCAAWLYALWTDACYSVPTKRIREAELRKRSAEIFIRATNEESNRKQTQELFEEFFGFVQAYCEQQKDQARFEQMVWVLLSCGGELEITKAALDESPKDFTVTTQPTSRLDGGLVYRLTNQEERTK